MRRLPFLVAVVLIAGCSRSSPPAPTSAPATAATAGAHLSSDASAAVKAVVQDFGKQMQKISVLAPPDAVRAELPKVYGDVLSPQLLAAWHAHPDRVAGREGSSPWPQQIEIDSVDCSSGETCSVTGKVDYITSNEVEHGGVFMRRGITLAVAHQDNGWRITAVHLAPAAQ